VLPTRIQLIDTIQMIWWSQQELTGSWEKQLKDIEKERLPLLRLSTIKRMVEALV
jgi:DNA topoisomerase-3